MCSHQFGNVHYAHGQLLGIYAAAQMQNATGIVRDERSRTALAHVLQLASQDVLSYLRAGDRCRATEAATDCTLLQFAELEAQHIADQSQRGLLDPEDIGRLAEV